MNNDLEKLFYQDVREKKTISSGAAKKKGRRGLVGKMVTPADFSGKDYQEAGEMVAYSISDLLCRLDDSPTLKSVLLAKLDEEHRGYRGAIEKTLDGLSEVLRSFLETLAIELNHLQARVETIETKVDTAPTRRHRIRWANDSVTIRHQVLDRLRSLSREGKEINTRTIREEAPGLLRWLYGKKAVFRGVGELLEAYREEPPAPPA